MPTDPQADVLQALAAYLRDANLPQAPQVHADNIHIVRREEIADKTLISVTPSVPVG